MTALTLYTVYDSPRDAPGLIVVRAHRVDNGHCTPSQDALQFLDLTEARMHLHRLGLFNMGRHERDDPAILETWI